MSALLGSVLSIRSGRFERPSPEWLAMERYGVGCTWRVNRPKTWHVWDKWALDMELVASGLTQPKATALAARLNSKEEAA